MLPRILARMLVRLDQVPERTEDEEDIYQALLGVAARLSPQREAPSNPDSFTIERLRGIYSSIDGPISLGPAVTGCKKSNCPLKKP